MKAWYNRLGFSIVGGIAIGTIFQHEPFKAILFSIVLGFVYAFISELVG